MSAIFFAQSDLTLLAVPHQERVVPEVRPRSFLIIGVYIIRIAARGIARIVAVVRACRIRLLHLLLDNVIRERGRGSLGNCELERTGRGLTVGHCFQPERRHGGKWVVNE